MSPERRDLLRAFALGARGISPLLTGILPTAMIAGTLAARAELTAGQEIGMSLMVFAGTAQIAALELIRLGAAPAVILLTALVINSRFVMYSASLAPGLRHLPGPLRSSLAYLITDENYAVFSSRSQAAGSAGGRAACFLGASLPLWIVWQGGTSAGYLAGVSIPSGWSLEFAVPLTFIAILAPHMRSAPDRAAAGAAALALLTGVSLPMNLGLPVAAIAGVAAGFAADRRARSRP